MGQCIVRRLRIVVVLVVFSCLKSFLSVFLIDLKEIQYSVLNVIFLIYIFNNNYCSAHRKYIFFRCPRPSLFYDVRVGYQPGLLGLLVHLLYRKIWHNVHKEI